MTFKSISTQEFPGSLACARAVTDRKNGKTCSQFTDYTDEPSLQVYVQAHNAGDGEFNVDVFAFKGRGLNGRSPLERFPF